MRSYPTATMLAAATLATFTSMFSAGCSSATENEAEPSHTSASTAAPAEPNASGVSPDGVTTRVDAPAEATESQYGQACLAAKRWMDERGGDPLALVEPYLKTLQEPGAISPGTFDVPWVDLSPGQQAGVIMAANGAANGECS